MHERISVHSMCFPGAGFAELADYWSRLGARRVSFISQQLDNGVEPARAALATGGYRLETVTHVFLPGRALDPDESTWREPRARLMRVIDATAGLGGRSIYMLSGGHGCLTWEQAAATFSAAFAPCVTRARDAG